MPRLIEITRRTAIVRVQRHLEHSSYPRVQMGLIMGLTGAFGMLCSYVLLQSGVGSMAVRYPLALAGAYLFFLLLLWLWLRSSADDWGSAADAADVLPEGGHGTSVPKISSGGGGDFGGAGAQGRWVPARDAAEVGSLPARSVAAPALPTDSGDTALGASVGDAVADASSADEVVIPLLVLALLLGLALASLYVVYLAPSLLAELSVDGALSYSVYRHLARTEKRHWLGTAVRRTGLPLLVTAVFVTLIGWGLSVAAPGAHTLGEALAASAANP